MGVERVPITERLDNLEELAERLEMDMPCMDDYPSWDSVRDEIYDCISNSDLNGDVSSAQERADEAHDQAEEACREIDTLESEVNELRDTVQELRDALEAVTSSTKD